MQLSKYLRLLALLAVAAVGLGGQPSAEGTLLRDHPAIRIFSSPEYDTWLRKLQMVAITPKISGGSQCPVNRFPYMVSIRNRVTLNHVCGGVLLNRFWVLTAAHCLGQAGRNPVVVAGTNLLDHGVEGEELFVTQSILHPNFTGDLSGGNDIALIELLDPTTKVQTFANLPDKNTKYSNGHQLLAIGWGTDGNEVQDSLDCSQSLLVVSQEQCRKLWSETESKPLITTSMVCAFSPISDTCKGDSGGPLIDVQSPRGKFSDGKPGFDVIGGVTSFGASCSGDNLLPGVYTFLPPFREWILETMSIGPKEEQQGKQDPTPSPPQPPKVNPKAFLAAAGEGDLETVKSELDKGVDIESKGFAGRTALLLASRVEGSVEVLTLLLDNGADIETRDNKGWTALILAVFDGHVESVRVLIERGADKEGRDDAGATPLYYAAQEGLLDVVKLLLDSGADTEAKFLKFGNTPIHTAAFKGHVDVVEELVSRGADVNASDDVDVTPLHQAAQKSGGSAIIVVLVNAGANIDAEDNGGATPLHYAAWNGHKVNVEKLVELGADKSLKNQKGNTPADDVCTCVIVSDACCCNVNFCNNSRMELVELL